MKLNPVESLLDIVPRPKKRRKHVPCKCDECHSFWYCTPCAGCPDGHPSFWKSVIESPQWAAWKKRAEARQVWDFAECEELGVCSAAHFQAFLAFTIAVAESEEF